IDPLEELRELEGIARRRTGRRNVVSPDSLLCFGADEGAASLGLEGWGEIEIDLEHPSLLGVDPADVFPALVFGCSADVLASSGRPALNRGPLVPQTSALTRLRPAPSTLNFSPDR